MAAVTTIQELRKLVQHRLSNDPRQLLIAALGRAWENYNAKPFAVAARAKIRI